MVRIGIIGVGFMGYTHFEASQKLRGAKVAAIATRNKKKLSGNWTDIQGNFGPRAGHVDLSKVKKYEDYHDLLADPDIDLVDVCLPNDLHEQVVCEALKAGKAVICEKPIATEVIAAKRMVKAAGKAGQLFMVAHVLPYFPEFQFVAECIKSEKYGPLRAAHFRRVITPPDWSADMSDFRKLGGWGIDLHIHDNHFINVACGIPQKVFAQGLLEDGLVNHTHTQYVYENNAPAVSAVSGGICATGLQFAHGFEFYFEKATIVYSAGTVGGEWAADRPLTLITNRGKPTQPKLKAGGEWYSAFTLELQDAVNAVKTGKVPNNLSAEVALNALKLCEAEAKSIATGRAVTIR